MPLARRLLHETPLDIVAENDRVFHRLATAATAYLSSPIGSSPSHDQLEAFDEATKLMDTIGPSRLGHLVAWTHASHMNAPGRMFWTWWRISRFRPVLILLAIIAGIMLIAVLGSP